MTEAEELGKAIREERERQGLSQEDLAALARVSRRPIYLLETGKGSVRLDSFLALCSALGMKMEVRPKGGLSHG